MLAPMLAATDIPFRQVCKSMGAVLTFTEMVSTQGVVRHVSDSFRNAVFDPDERPVAIQLLAWKVDTVAAAIAELLPFKPALFDINSGCPSDAICDMGGGAALLDNLHRLTAIVSEAAKASSIPVSVKIRAGGSSRRHTVTELARALEDSGAALITVHGRSRGTPYEEPANWELITQVKEAVSVPVVGNGDVFSSRDAFDMMYATGCDAVMVARGSLGSPWIFRDIAARRSCSAFDHAPEGTELHLLVRDHLRAIARMLGSLIGVPRMRKHALWYARFFPGWENLRTAIFASNDPESILGAVDTFFGAHPRRLHEDSRELFLVEQRFRKRVLFWLQQDFDEVLG